jgi:transcriptional regulator with XRE-family HTH domain
MSQDEEFLKGLEKEEKIQRPKSGPSVGEKIKRLREKKRVSLQDFAERTGFSSAILSEIENRFDSPSLGALIEISKALDVEVGYFFKKNPTKRFSIVRKDKRMTTSRFALKSGVKYGYSYESLGQDKKNRHMEPFIVTLEPSTLKNEKPSKHAGEEFIFVLEGEMEVILEDHRDILYPGDSIYYDSQIEHLVKCHKGKTTKILAVLYTGSKKVT